MKTLLMTSGKGGVGKSTLARTVAVAAAQGGGSVLLVDLDPQQTLRRWWEARDAQDLAMLENDPSPGALKETLAAARKRYDWVVIDTPPSSPDWLVNVMKLADLAIVPVRPSPDDMRAIGVTLAALRKAGTAYVFALTQVQPRGRLIEESARALGEKGRVCGTRIGFRVAFQETAATGQGVTEAGDAKAAAEASALWDFILEAVA